MSDDLAAVVRDEIATPENTCIDQHRLLSDLLSPDALALNTFGPLRLDPDLGTAVLRRLLPDPGLAVVSLHFERPISGIGSSVFVRYRTGSGGRGFVLIRVLLTETLKEPCPELSLQTERLLDRSALFGYPPSPALRRLPLRHLSPEHLRAQALLERSVYHRGDFILVVPSLNRPAWAAVERYCSLLTPLSPGTVSFRALSLETVVDAISDAGDPEYARRLQDRYLEFDPVEAAISASRQGRARQP